MPIITLLSDFGTSDTFIGVMKGVIWSIAPDVRISDLTHEIKHADVFAASLALVDAIPYFPEGTVHICVVDPGVGTERRAMAARIGGQYFIGPDNGVFSHVIDAAQSQGETPTYIRLTNPQYWLPKVSRTFHGRDIFAPVGAHLSHGTALEVLGEPFDDPITFDLPKPQPIARGWQGVVIGKDHFGNLVTNLTREQVPNNWNVFFEIKNHVIHGMVDSFGMSREGELGALFDSNGRVSFFINGGSADKRLKSLSGDLVIMDTTGGGIGF